MLSTARWIFVLFALLSLDRDAAATWEKMYQFGDPTNVETYVSACWFFDEANGIVGVTTNGGYSIQLTSDGGKSWQKAVTPIRDRQLIFSDFFMTNRNAGWVTFYYEDSTSNLWRTYDGGKTWQEMSIITSPASIHQTSTSVVISEYSVPLGNTGMLYSDNAGLSFQSITMTPAGAISLIGMDFSDDKNGVVSGFIGDFYYTANAGRTWRQSVGTKGLEAWGVYAVKGSSFALVAPEDANKPGPTKIYRSSDYGASWNLVTSLPVKSTGEILGHDNIVYAQGLAGQAESGIYRSTDLGSTWVNIGGPSNKLDTRMAVAGCGLVLFAFDERGGVYRTTDGGDQPFVIADSLRLTLKLQPDHASAGDTITLSIAPDRDIGNRLLNTISGSLSFDDDLLALIDANTSLAGATLARTASSVASGRVILPFSLSGTNLTLQKDSPIVTVRLRVTLADSSHTDVVLQDLSINKETPEFERCSLKAFNNKQVFTLDLNCGDSTIQQYLRRSLALSLVGVSPQPATIASDYKSSITIESNESGQLVFSVFDANGALITALSDRRDGPGTHTFRFDGVKLPSGIYRYTVDGREGTLWGEIVLVK